MAVQQKPQVETQTPTANQSLVLVRNLIRIAISTVAYERKLFPDEFFRDRVLSGVNIKSLSPGDSNSTQLVSWLEEGVFDALDKKYLEKIIVNLYNNPECKTPFEKYEFSIQYSKDDEFVSVHISRDGFGSYSREEIRDASLDLVTKLITLLSRLPPVPNQCFCTLHLQYRPSAPLNYEPKGFSAISPADDDLPFVHRTGSVITEHHSMSLSVKLPVNLFEDMETQPSQKKPSNSQQQSGEVQNPEDYRAHLRELNVRVLKWLAAGKKDVQLKEIKDTFEVSEKLARELIKNLEFKKVLGSYIPMKGRKVLHSEESKNYFASYGLTLELPMERTAHSKNSDLPKRAVAPSPNTRSEIAMHQSIINPSQKSSIDEEENWVDQPRNLRKRKQDHEDTPVASVPSKKKHRKESQNLRVSETEFQRPSLKKAFNLQGKVVKVS